MIALTLLLAPVLPATLQAFLRFSGKPDRFVHLPEATPPALVFIYKRERIACSFWDTKDGWALKGCIDTSAEWPITNELAARKLYGRGARTDPSKRRR